MKRVIAIALIVMSGNVLAKGTIMGQDRDQFYLNERLQKIEENQEEQERQRQYDINEEYAQERIDMIGAL